MNGILVIYKDKGFTSHDVVAVVRKLIGERHLGHTGTLDPNATGVLPVCIGSCTRLIEYMDSVPKKYRAKARLGISTDTHDIWGTVLSEADHSSVSEDKLLDVIPHYVGDISQIPSVYSSVRVKGRHLYSYAHSGEEVEVPSREVKVYGIELLSFDGETGEFSLEISCGRGTYVRTILSDIGNELGCGACMTELVRTSACGYELCDCISLDELKAMPKEDIEKLLRDPVTAIGHIDKVYVSEEQLKDFANGKHLKVDQNGLPSDKPVSVMCGDVFCGIGEWDNPNRIKPVKVFVR